MRKRRGHVREGIGVNGFAAIVTAIVTIATSIVVGIIEPDGSNRLLYTLCDRGFYVGLSALIVELLYNFFLLQKSTSEMSKSIHIEDCIIFPKDNAVLERCLEDAFKNEKTKSVKIICYGTSKYARVIEKLQRDHEHINAEVIVFSPNETIMNFVKDKQKLIDVICSMEESKNITLYLTKIPPTIRGSVFLNKSQLPLFCMIQPYYLNPLPNAAVLVMGKNVTPAMVAQDENSPILLDLSDVFLTEFTRLKNHSIAYIDWKKQHNPLTKKQ